MATLREWLIDKSGATLSHIESVWRGSDGSSLEISESTLDDLWLWSARWRLAPHGPDGDRWQVELHLAPQPGSPQSDPLEFEAIVSNSDVRQRAPRSLSVVRRLIERHDCRHGGIRLRLGARPVTAVSADWFRRKWLCNERRQLPLIAISRNRDGRCARDPDDVQRALAGRALVAVWDSEVSPIVTQPLGGGLGCDNGSVRVYRPQPTSTDSPEHHPLTGWREAQEGSFPDLLCRQVHLATHPKALLSPCTDIAKRLQRAEGLALETQLEDVLEEQAGPDVVLADKEAHSETGLELRPAEGINDNSEPPRPRHTPETPAAELNTALAKHVAELRGALEARIDALNEAMESQVNQATSALGGWANTMIHPANAMHELLMDAPQGQIDELYVILTMQIDEMNAVLEAQVDELSETIEDEINRWAAERPYPSQPSRDDPDTAR